MLIYRRIGALAIGLFVVFVMAEDLGFTSAVQAQATDAERVQDPGLETGRRENDRGYWERHEKLINSIKTLIAVVALSYGVKLTVWLIKCLIAWVHRGLGGRRFSVKRAGTLLSFAGSIIKLFIWIFGAIAILGEFGVDPIKSTGAIGLIGLIMAGMFQQIVIDFVKGLDVIAGGHYSVGDFIEVDGKMGYVVDFNVKYTRIRTASGQQFNIPNSLCVPSRRFPDGFVDNYVDLTLVSSENANEAERVIGPVCRDLNRRIELIRRVPTLAERFNGPADRVTLRYQVRVLPGSDWVITEHFIPSVKKALADRGVELSGEPTFFFINQIETFRKLFSRRLSEREIIQQTSEDSRAPTPAGESALPENTSD